MSEKLILTLLNIAVLVSFIWSGNYMAALWVIIAGLWMSRYFDIRDKLFGLIKSIEDVYEKQMKEQEKQNE